MVPLDETHINCTHMIHICRSNMALTCRRRRAGRAACRAPAAARPAGGRSAAPTAAKWWAPPGPAAGSSHLRFLTTALLQGATDHTVPCSPHGSEMVATTRSCRRDAFVETFSMTAVLQGAVDDTARWRPPSLCSTINAPAVTPVLRHRLAAGCYCQHCTPTPPIRQMCQVA